MQRRDSRFLSGLIILSMPIMAGYSVDGGGRAEVSPYSSNEMITTQRVNRERDLARKSMIATYKIDGAIETIRAVGLVWSKGGRVIGPTKYSLSGATDNGDLPSIDFSEIQELSIVKSETTSSPGRALFRVNVFPNISVEQLVNMRPTYSELKERYSRTLDLWVDIKTSTSGDLCFVGKDLAPRRLETFNNNTVVKFEYVGGGRTGQGIWWAIPSVIRDSAYPYRRPPTKA